MRLATRIILLLTVGIVLAGGGLARADQDRSSPAGEPSGIYVETAGQPAARLPMTYTSDFEMKGVAKSILTQGFSRPKQVATHPGASAGMVVTSASPVFVFRFADMRTSPMPMSMMGDADALPPTTDEPKHFTLAKMTVVDDARVIDTGKLERWEMEVKRLRAREFQVTPKRPLVPGEYAFFVSRGAPSPTQIWAFSYQGTTSPR